MYDLIIVGAGPAGIFTALELLRKSCNPHKILLIEKGKPVEKRHCPKDKTGVCVNCKPTCAITTGFSGAGAFSDGKLSLSYQVGGELPDLIGEDFAQELIDYTDKIYLEFGADPKVEGVYEGPDIKDIRKRAIQAGLQLVDCPIRHLGTEKAQQLYLNIQNYLADAGVEMLFNTECENIILEDSVCKNFGRPLDTMTIRSYCKYYRIAHEAYGRYFERFDTTRKIRTLPNGVPLELQDVAYYNMVKFCDLQDKYALDNETDFNKFASDHYGELGLLRLNILASDFDSPGWRIIVSNSYSAYVDVAVEVATALYKSGAPLEIHDAAKLLRILKEKDHVKLIPYTFHDYMGHHEEGTVYQLPWEYECMDSEENVLSLKQYHDIISLAEWDEIEKVNIDKNEVVSKL
mgnify:CR=1 FL=1